MDEIPRWHNEIMKIICKFEKEMPIAFMDIQVHLLIHLVDIEIAHFISTRSMFFVERVLKLLKEFIKQKSRPKGSMCEGYMVQKSFFLCKWVSISNSWLTPTICLQVEKYVKKLEGEVLEINESPYALNKGTNYILHNSNIYKYQF